MESRSDLVGVETRTTRDWQMMTDYIFSVKKVKGNHQLSTLYWW